MESKKLIDVCLNCTAARCPDAYKCPRLETAKRGVVYKGHKRKLQPYYEFEGKRHTCSEWARIKGMGYTMLHDRLLHGWSIEAALTTPPRGRYRKWAAFGQEKTMSEWAKLLGCTYSKLWWHVVIKKRSIEEVCDMIGVNV